MVEESPPTGGSDCSYASALSVLMPPLFYLSVRLVCLFGNLLGFFVEVAGSLPLPAVFFGSFLTHAGTLPFAFLAAMFSKACCC
jgi:uncharacterized membrane protein YdjX (TVP38/TMEM64 family)